MITIPSRLLDAILLFFGVAILLCAPHTEETKETRVKGLVMIVVAIVRITFRRLKRKQANGAGVVLDQMDLVYRKAAEQGLSKAQNYLGHVYSSGLGVAKDPVEAVKWFRKAADQGDALAQSSLALAYKSGIGVAKDAVEAYAWFNLAAVTYEDAKKKRAELEKSMTAQQIADGQRRSTELSALIEPKYEVKYLLTK